MYGIQSILDGIKVVQKWLVDKILNLDYNKICMGLFRCTEFLHALLEPNSLIMRQFQKINPNISLVSEEMFDIINDFSTFQAQVCNFGFTYNFGISAIREQLNKYRDIIESLIKTLNKYEMIIKKQLQSYLDFLKNSGLLDLLDKLKAFFDCVLIDTEVCSTIKTTNSFYNKCLRDLHIQEDGNGYKLETNWLNSYTNSFDSRINQLDNCGRELDKLVESLLNPSQVTAAKNAFNISNNIFPGGFTGKDMGNLITGKWNKVNWNNNKTYSYFKTTRRDLLNAIKGNVEDKYSTDEILEATTIDDKNGYIKVSLGNEKEIKYTKDNLPSGITYETENIEVNYISDGNEYNKCAAYYDESTDSIISTMRAAIEISILNNENIKSQCIRKFTFDNYTDETLLVKELI